MSTSMTPQALVDAKNRTTLAYLADRAFPLMPGALELLSRWHRSGRPLAIVTGAGPEGVAATLKHHGLTAWVSTVVTGEDVPRSKPAPDVYLLALQRLGLPASQCLAVEDTQHGVMAATAAGQISIEAAQPKLDLGEAFAERGAAFERPIMNGATMRDIPGRGGA